jgi:AraC-like DNA-binding protein
MLPADYAIYLPKGTTTDPWGVCVTSVGHSNVTPGALYPSGTHPTDHTLTWRRGRALHQYQIVYIAEGSGRFESAATGLQKIKSGTVFLLFPNVWHRYKPEPSTGWIEYWIELQGDAIDQLVRTHVITPDRPLFRLGSRPELVDLFQQGRALVRNRPAGHQPLLAMLGMQILAQTLCLATTGAPGAQRSSSADQRIRRAQTLMSESPDRLLQIEQIAMHVGMSYSYFRRLFRARTGMSPKQYHLQLRLRRVQELLTNTSLSVKQIADTLGFDSPFHLSRDFKSRTRLSPTRWREQLTGGDRRPD